MTEIKEIKELLKQEMNKQRLRDNFLRAGLAAIIGGESGWKPKWESSWKNTSNERIKIFFSRLRSLSNDELNRVKSDDVTFFDAVYGGRYGNVNPGDGYKYRGGGLIQLTFHDNYKQIGEDIGEDLVNLPDLIVNDPRISVAASVAYMKRHYKGSGNNFNQMKASVGLSMGEPDGEKNRLYYQYLVSGEFNYNEEDIKDDDKDKDKVTGVLDPIVVNFLISFQACEKFLAKENDNDSPYRGPIDRDPGPKFRESLLSYLARHK